MKIGSDGFGRTLGYTALAGLVFAALVVVTPKIASSANGDVGSLDAVIAGKQVSGATPANQVETHVTSATTTTQAADPTTTSTTIAPEATTTTADLEDQARHDGSVQLWVSQRFDPAQNQAAPVADGETVEWSMTVTNTSDGTLYGVFVYLELHGQVPCSDHRLSPGASMSCSLVTKVYSGDHSAEVWVDAWAGDRLVQDEEIYRFWVTD